MSTRWYITAIKMTKEEYDKEPVYYCRNCLSLRIMDIGLDDTLYCDKCGSTRIGESNIYSWELAFEHKYGFKYILKNGREHN